MFLAQLGWRAACVNLLDIGICYRIVGILVVLATIDFVLVHVEVVRVHGSCGQSFEGIYILSKVEGDSALSQHLVTLVLSVSADRAGHFGYSVLAQIQILIVQHGVLWVGISCCQRALAPVVADDVGGRCVRCVTVIEHAVYLQLKVQSFHNLSVNLRCDVKLVVVQVAALQETFLIEVTHAHEILHLFRTAADSHVMIGLRGCLGKNQLVPVGALFGTVTVFFDSLFGKHGSTSVDVVLLELVHQRHGTNGIEQLRHAFGSLDGERTAVTDLCITLTALLGGNKQYAVSGTQTIDGCRGIFQHRDVLDIVGIHALEILNRTGHPINNDQWCTKSAHVEIVSVGSRLCTLLPNANAGNSAC